MPHYAHDFDKALAIHSALRQLILSHPGGWPDEVALRRVQDFCRRALNALNDPGSQEVLDRIEQLVRVMFSEEEHKRWDRPGQSGVAHVKTLILRELIAFRIHVTSIQATRHHSVLEAPTSAGKAPGTERR